MKVTGSNRPATSEALTQQQQHVNLTARLVQQTESLPLNYPSPTIFCADALSHASCVTVCRFVCLPLCVPLCLSVLQFSAVVQHPPQHLQRAAATDQRQPGIVALTGRSHTGGGGAVVM